MTLLYTLRVTNLSARMKEMCVGGKCSSGVAASYGHNHADQMYATIE